MMVANNPMYKPALLIIDMQNDFVLPGAPARVEGAYDTVGKVKELLNFFREKDQPVFHIVREYRPDGSDVENTRLRDFMNNHKYAVHGTNGCRIIDDLQPLNGEYIVVKTRFSAFMNTELDFMLRRLNVNETIICGTQFPNCIRATVYDAVSYGYRATLIKDATSAATPQIAKANILDIQNIGIPCIDLDTYKTSLS